MSHSDRIRMAMEAYDKCIKLLQDAPQFSYVMTDLIELQGSYGLLEAMLEPDSDDVPSEAYDPNDARDIGWSN